MMFGFIDVVMAVGFAFVMWMVVEKISKIANSEIYKEEVVWN